MAATTRMKVRILVSLEYVSNLIQFVPRACRSSDPWRFRYQSRAALAGDMTRSTGHDERDYTQDVFHEDSDRTFCFAVSSVSQLPSRNLPTFALFDACGLPSRVKHRESRRIARNEKAIR